MLLKTVSIIAGIASVACFAGGHFGLFSEALKTWKKKSDSNGSK